MSSSHDQVELGVGWGGAGGHQHHQGVVRTEDSQAAPSRTDSEKPCSEMFLPHHLWPNMHAHPSRHPLGFGSLVYSENVSLSFHRAESRLRSCIVLRRRIKDDTVFNLCDNCCEQLVGRRWLIGRGVEELINTWIL